MTTWQTDSADLGGWTPKIAKVVTPERTPAPRAKRNGTREPKFPVTVTHIVPGSAQIKAERRPPESRNARKARQARELLEAAGLPTWGEPEGTTGQADRPGSTVTVLGLKMPVEPSQPKDQPLVGVSPSPRPIANRNRRTGELRRMAFGAEVRGASQEPKPKPVKADPRNNGLSIRDMVPREVTPPANAIEIVLNAVKE